jgi:hypothetical protein
MFAERPVALTLTLIGAKRKLLKESNHAERFCAENLACWKPDRGFNRRQPPMVMKIARKIYNHYRQDCRRLT